LTRIIAGSARGRRLAVPPSGTRPTADRVREAMFATLDHLLGGFAGARVLDLFAGSGALGLEAASRGASEVLLVERDRRAADIIRANARTVGGTGVAVVERDVAGMLAGGAAAPFDLVLADPPYDMAADEVTRTLASVVSGGWLQPDGVAVVERAARGEGLIWPPGFVALRRNTYGQTSVWYGLAASAEGDT
jgi:16S rRNA (guanine966-N2)-methyltransferase